MRSPAGGREGHGRRSIGLMGLFDERAWPQVEAVRDPRERRR